MKKFLSLVLTLAMALTLVTVSAGATDFEDDEDIAYQEAVTVIAGIGVVDGYTDDTFRPDEVLTRGAAAKIICNLILGPTTASVLSASSAPFVDVPTTNTFAGYITYCAQQGIISGYADGTFRPTGTLTGNAFMKMLLGALGYDSTNESYTGANWQVSVLKQAVGIGLTDGNDDFLGSEAVTRGEACLYAFNMLQATMVEYSSSSTVTVGDVTVSNTSTRSDVTNSTSTDGNIEKDGLMQFAEKYFSKLVAEDDTDGFGRPATTWTYSGTELGTYANDADATYVIDSADKTLTTLMTDGDYLNYATKDILTTAEVYVNGDDQGTYVSNTSAILGGIGDIIEVYENDDGDVDTIVFRSYTYAKIDEISSDLASTYTNRGASVSIDLVDIDDTSMGTYYDDYNTSAYILEGYNSSYTEGTVLAVAMNDAGAILDSYVMDSVTGTPTAAKAVTYSTANTAFIKSGNVTIDGTKYTYAGTMTGLDADAVVSFDQDYTLYLTAEGYVLAVDGDALAALDDVYYVAGVYSTSSSGRYTYYLEAVSVKDGATYDLQLSTTGITQFGCEDGNVGGSSSNSYSTEVAGLYVLDSSSGKYFIDSAYISDKDTNGSYTDWHEGVLKDGQTVGSYIVAVSEYSGTYGEDSYVSGLSQDVESTSTTIRFSNRTATDEPTRLYLTDDTFFVSVDGDASMEDITVKTATGMMTVDAAKSKNLSAYAFYKESDSDAVFVVYAADSLSGSVNIADVVYLTADATTAVSDGYLGDVYFMGSMTLEEDLVLDDDYDQGFYTYEIDDDGLYVLSYCYNYQALKGDEDAEVDDEDGYAADVTFTSINNGKITGTFAILDEEKGTAQYDDEGNIITGSFVAAAFSSATVIDTRSSSAMKNDVYTAEINSASKLSTAVNRGNVVADVFVEDGAIVFVAVTAVEDAASTAGSISVSDVTVSVGSTTTTTATLTNISSITSVTSSASTVATATISGTTVTVTGVSLGTATITITALGTDGLYYTATFDVTVAAATTTVSVSGADSYTQTGATIGLNYSDSTGYVTVTLTNGTFIDGDVTNNDDSALTDAPAVSYASSNTVAYFSATAASTSGTATITLYYLNASGVVATYVITINVTDDDATMDTDSFSVSNTISTTPTLTAAVSGAAVSITSNASATPARGETITLTFAATSTNANVNPASVIFTYKTADDDGVDADGWYLDDTAIADATITVTVTAESGATQTYNYTVTIDLSGS